MLSPPGGWSSLKVTGQAPLPCSHFTLTTVGEKRAAMYGGYDGSNTFIVELGRHSVVSVFTKYIQKIPKIEGLKFGWIICQKLSNILHVYQAFVYFTILGTINF